MHALLRAEDRIDRTGGDAQRAANARGFVDDGNEQWAVRAAFWSERSWRASRQRRERDNHGLPSGRAAIDVGRADCHGIRIGPARGVSAAHALGLRQRCVDTFGE